MDPAINVIIPVLNGAGVLLACLESLGRQSYAGDILPVVINDGSTDDIAKIVQKFKNIKLIEQENLGRSVARNRGIAESSASIIAFIDADCVADPRWLEKLVARLFERPKRGVISGAMTLPANANIWQRLDHQAWAHSIGPSARAKPTIFGSTANMMVFREVLRDVGGFDARLRGSEDSDFAFRVHSAGYENYFEPAAIVVHNHQRITGKAFFRQRFNYGKWTIQTILKHKPLPPFSRMFPNNWLLLALFWPFYSFLATGFTVIRNLPHDPSVLWLSPLHLLGRMVEYAGTVAGCGEYQRLFCGKHSRSADKGLP